MIDLDLDHLHVSRIIDRRLPIRTFCYVTIASSNSSSKPTFFFAVRFSRFLLLSPRILRGHQRCKYQLFIVHIRPRTGSNSNAKRVGRQQLVDTSKRCPKVGRPGLRWYPSARYPLAPHIYLGSAHLQFIYLQRLLCSFP